MKRIILMFLILGCINFVGCKDGVSGSYETVDESVNEMASAEIISKKTLSRTYGFSYPDYMRFSEFLHEIEMISNSQAYEQPEGLIKFMRKLKDVGVYIPEPKLGSPITVLESVKVYYECPVNHTLWYEYANPSQMGGFDAITITYLDEKQKNTDIETLFKEEGIEFEYKIRDLIVGDEKVKALDCDASDCSGTWFLFVKGDIMVGAFSRVGYIDYLFFRDSEFRLINVDEG